MWADGVPNVASYESIALRGTEHLLVLDHFPWGWTDKALAEAHATTTYLGPAYGGDLVSVRFPSSTVAGTGRPEPNPGSAQGRDH